MAGARRSRRFDLRTAKDAGGFQRLAIANAEAASMPRSGQSSAAVSAAGNWRPDTAGTRKRGRLRHTPERGLPGRSNGASRMVLEIFKCPARSDVAAPEDGRAPAQIARISQNIV